MAEFCGELFQCKFCSFLSVTRKDLLKHIKESHVHDIGFSMNCLLCGRTFRVFSSFTSHVSRCHPGVLAETAYETYQKSNLHSTQEEDDYNGLLSSMENESNDMECRSSAVALNDQSSIEDKIYMSAGSFIVGLKEKHLVRIPQFSYIVITPLTYIGYSNMY